MLLHQSNGTLTDFRRKFVVLAHGSIFSKVGASSKLGAIQFVEHWRKTMALKTLLGVAALALGMLSPSQAAAQYPDRPIRMIIPFAAGGPADLVGREFAQRLGDHLGQPVVVVNAGGGHGVPALNQLLGAPADGYTLLMPASGNMTIPSKAMRDKQVLELLTPISQLTQSPHVLV